MNTFAILCPLLEELLAVVSHFPSTDFQIKHARRWYSLKYQNKDLIFVEGKVGRTQSRKTVKFLQQYVSPDVIIHFGTAGAISPVVSVGDIIMAQHTLEYDIKEKYESVDPMLLNIELSMKVQKGMILSANQNIASDAQKEHLYQKYKALCGDWESGTVVRTGNECGIPTIALRVISDSGTNTFEQEFLAFIADQLPQKAKICKEYVDLFIHTLSS